MLLLFTSSDLCVIDSNDPNLSAELTQRNTFSLSFVMTRKKEKKGLVSSFSPKALGFGKRE